MKFLKASETFHEYIIINQFILNSKQDLKPLEYSDVTFWLYADNLLLINCSSVWDYLAGPLELLKNWGGDVKTGGRNTQNNPIFNIFGVNLRQIR